MLISVSLIDGKSPYAAVFLTLQFELNRLVEIENQIALDSQFIILISLYS